MSSLPQPPLDPAVLDAADEQTRQNTSETGLNALDGVSTAADVASGAAEVAGGVFEFLAGLLGS